MYTHYFGLKEKPFAITPDPRFFYLSERHTEALALLQYGVMDSGGFIQLTGEVGTGKTTVTRTLISRLPEGIEVAAILNPRVTVLEFLYTVCEEFGLPLREGREDNKSLVDKLNQFLLRVHASGRRAVLIVDEAQALEREVLEQLRLLTNLETETTKLLQIILVGQPELRQTLQRTDLRQLAQRITGRYHLGKLTHAETVSYIKHRLAIAGCTDDLFTPMAMWQIHRRAGGVPRLINVICDRALLGAYSTERKRVDFRMVNLASAEVQGHQGPGAYAAIGLAALGVLLVLGGGFALLTSDSPDGLQFADDRANAANVPTASAPANLAPSAITQQPTRQQSRPVKAPASKVATTSAPKAAPVRRTPAASNNAASNKPAATPRRGPSLNQVLVRSADITDTDSAFENLFRLWNINITQGGGAPCSQLLRKGLRCEHQLGSWTLLRAMNRPAILSLVDANGNPHHVVARAMDDQHLSLLIGGKNYEFPLTEITPQWFGEYLVIWRPSKDADRLMLPGARGPGVQWLRDTLASLTGTDNTTGEPQYYDSALEAQVRNFQRTSQLKADGKAGLQTLIALNSALSLPGTPYLKDGG